MSDKAVLVTGGAGFVGSVLAKKLVSAGLRVVCIDDLSNGMLENLPPEASFIEADLSTDAAFRELDQYQFDAVIHCAAQSSNAISFDHPANDLLSNQFATLKLLQYCYANDIKRFIFTSSMSAYGDIDRLPINEKTRCQPASFYAVHKLAAEEYVNLFSKNYGLDTTIFRLFTTYGYGQNLNNRMQGLISIYLSYILDGEPLVVKGSPDRVRDIIHVSDVVEAISASIAAKKTFGQTYNLGTGITLTIKGIITHLLAEAGHSIADYPISWEAATPGDPHAMQADISAIERDLGWQPKISPIEGIKAAVRHYRSVEV